MGGSEVLRLVDARTGNTVEIEVTPQMAPEDILKKLVEKGVIGKDEPAVFGFINDEGKLEPKPFGCARDLIEASKFRTIGFEAQRYYGRDDALFDKHMRGYGQGRGFRWNDCLECYVAQYLSKYDNKCYSIYIKPKRTYPAEPPDVFIYPYPEYVNYDPKFEDNHIGPCIFRKTTDAGVSYGQLHIEQDLWDKVCRRCVNPLAIILDTIVLFMDLVPVYSASEV